MEVGKKYKHLVTGEEFEVLAISKPELQHDRRVAGILWSGQHVDIPGLIVHICEGNIHTVSVPDVLVVYSGKSGVWVRPIKMWAGRFIEVGPEKPKTPEELRKERFAGRELKEGNSSGIAK